MRLLAPRYLKSTSRSETTRAALPHSYKFCTFCLRSYACSHGFKPFRKGKKLSSSDILCRALAQKSPCCSAGLLWSVSHSSRNDVPSTTHYQVRTEPSTQPSAAPRFRSSTSLCRPPPISPNVWHSGAFQSQPPCNSPRALLANEGSPPQKTIKCIATVLRYWPTKRGSDERES